VTAPLHFRCTGCGDCCRSLRVAVTALDVMRLAQATGTATRELVAWLAPDAVDMSGEPESFVELSEGRRLMVLRQTDGACSLLGAGDRCGAYAARPRDCRAFPFDFEPAPRPHHSASRRLALLPLAGCDHADDGKNELTTLEAEDAARWRELQSYQALVSRWNRRAFHRRRLHKSVGGAAAFLAFAEQALLASNESAESKTVP
jgi:Fe-S-cluster containining protein